MSSQSQNLAFPSQCLSGWELNALEGKSNSKVAKNIQLCVKLCCQSRNGISQYLVSLKILPFLLTVYIGENWMHWRGKRRLKWLKNIQLYVKLCCQSHNGSSQCLVSVKILPFLLTVYLGENWTHWRGNRILKWLKTFNYLINSAVKATIGPHNVWSVSKSCPSFSLSI